MTEENFEKAETLMLRIRELSRELKHLVHLDGKNEADVFTIQHDGETIFYLHACDELMHEILRHVINRLSAEKDELVKEFETL